MEKCLSDDQLLVFASTGSVYGLVNGTNCPEETVANPLSHYAATKIQAEKIVSKKKNAVILRFATAFGVSFRMRLDLLVNQFVYEAVKYRALLVYGEKSVRSVIHVRDIAQSILFTIKHRDLMPGQVFNVGSSSLMFTKGQIARQIKNQIEYDLQFGESYADLDRRNYSLSTDKIEALGYRTKVSLDEGLFELISTVRKIKVDKSYFNSGIASEYTGNSRLLRQLSVFGGFP
jgi:nucleoside-diphosphate-sugar epimerase